MEPIKVKGIVLHSNDYKEQDKLVTIFTLEGGKITALLKGVKKSNAKLKYASQPFCFADWILVKKNNFYTITAVDLIDSFYSISTDYDKMLLGADSLNICDQVLKSGIVSHSLFVELVTTLKFLVYEKVCDAIVFLKFLIRTLEINGYGLHFGDCGECEEKLLGKVYLDIYSGMFFCEKCKGNNASNFYEISAQDYGILKIINSSTYEKLESIKTSEKSLYKLLGVFKKLSNNLLGIQI